MILEASLFVMGLVGSVHCVAMCGGVSAKVCGANEASVSEASSRFGLFHGGRMASYALAGAGAGWFGSIPGNDSVGLVVRASLLLISGVVLGAVGLQLLGLSQFARSVESIGKPLWSFLSSRFGRLTKGNGAASTFLLGALWGWIPCGLSYSALALSMTAGSPQKGALGMAAFALGTSVVLYASTIAARGLLGAHGSWRKLGGALLFASAIFQTATALTQLRDTGDTRPHCCHSKTASL